ncbi:uncharacterized protein LOC142767426 [Rhipicephalus microplus]|uniref:uncharacterized protein LOC142767426 n=1 Tax=Rhipicephalus microplus TaxID=6941 RepID=UPI003F6C922C
MSAPREFCPLTLLADTALLENRASAPLEHHNRAPSLVTSPSRDDTRRYVSAPIGEVARFGSGAIAQPEQCTRTWTTTAPFGMHGSSMSQRSETALSGASGAQIGTAASAVAEFCPLAATQPSSQAHFEHAPAPLAASGLAFSREAAPRVGCEKQALPRVATAGIHFETAPLIELGDSSPSLARAANAPTASFEAGAQTLLQNAAQMIRALTGAVQTLSAIPKRPHPAVTLAVPTYSGYGDLQSARDYLDSLARYQRAMGLDDEEVLGRVVPAALTDTAARWHRLSGHRAATLDEFRAAFLREFLPADYESRMRRELELRTQAPDESLQEYVRAMEDLFSIAEPRASNEERVERVIRQAHPTFSAYLRGSRFRDLEQLAVEAKRIQGDILAARSYHPPPPASEALEPRCAWGGAMTLSQRQQPAGAAFAATPTAGRAWEISDRALDPYTYGRRAAGAASQLDAREQGRNPTQCITGGNGRQSGSFDHAANPPRQLAAAPSRERDRDGVRCFRCRQRGHIARECSAFVPPVRQGNGSAGRS